MSPKDRLLHHIEQHLDDPTLSPGSAAAALGWSLRQVHAVMEAEQLTFMRSVTHLRLCRARSLLLQRQGTAVDVTFACGFNSRGIGGGGGAPQKVRRQGVGRRQLARGAGRRQPAGRLPRRAFPSPEAARGLRRSALLLRSPKSFDDATIPVPKCHCHIRFAMTRAVSG